MLLAVCRVLWRQAGRISARMQMPHCQGKHFGWRSSSVYPHHPSTIYPQKENKNLGQITCCVSGVLPQTIQRTTGVKMQIADNSLAQLSTLVRTGKDFAKHNIEEHLIILALQFVSCDVIEGIFFFFLSCLVFEGKAEIINLLKLILKYI